MGLWIGLHLPHLSLETFAATVSAHRVQPLAIVQGHRIVDVNDRAFELGVAPGLKRATALALAPQLLLGTADAQRDARALSSVAHCALGFTPAVSLRPRNGVVMEVQSSLRYFGGKSALLDRLKEALQPLKHHTCIATAPTAHAAALLSRWSMACIART